MSLMNCTFTVRWSDEKNKPHAKTYETDQVIYNILVAAVLVFAYLKG